MSQENETRLVEVVNPLCRDISSIQTRCLDHMSWWSLMAFYESGMSILAASNSLFARATVSRNRLQCEKESLRKGAWRAQTLYMNIHMIEKQLRPQPGAPFGQA